MVSSTFDYLSISLSPSSISTLHSSDKSISTPSRFLVSNYLDIDTMLMVNSGSDRDQKFYIIWDFKKHNFCILAINKFVQLFRNFLVQRLIPFDLCLKLRFPVLSAHPKNKNPKINFNTRTKPQNHPNFCSFKRWLFPPPSGFDWSK
jgi:hypothetical protein